MSGEDSGDAQRLNQCTRNRLEIHRADYVEVTGKPFDHFFCPILLTDEPGELMRGHVINEAYKGSSKAWVIQRKDVDGFYGGFFEGDFELLQYKNRASLLQHFTDPKLFRAARPMIYCRDQVIQYFLRLGKDRLKPPPPGFQFVEWEIDGEEVILNVRASNEQMMLGPGAWEHETKIDLRLPACVSLIKAAHLSMFSVLGYRYVLSNAGRFVAQDILGTFFQDNRQVRTKKEAQRRALQFFKPFRHMVRPMQSGGAVLDGTLSDGAIRLCTGASGNYWGMMIFVRTGQVRHTVLLPYPESANSMVTFLEFIRNDHEQVQVVEGQFDSDARRWIIGMEQRPVLWPKPADAYPRSIE